MRASSPWLLLAALACSGGSDGSASGGPTAPAPPTVRDSAGITIVENAEPQWPAGAEWCVGDVVMSVGEAEGEPAYELYWVRDATRLSDGTVAIGSSALGEIRFFDASGTFLRTVGSNDGGPGEFRGAHALRALRRVPGDTLVAWDIYAQAVSIFAPDGTFVRSFRLDGAEKQHFFQGIYEDGSLLMLAYDYARTPVDAMVEGLNRDGIILYHYGTDHVLAGTLAGLPASDRFQARWGEQGMMSTEAPFGRTTTASAGGTRTYVSTGDTDEVGVYDRQGALRMLIRRTDPPVEVTHEMVQQDQARRMAEGGRMLADDRNVSARARRLFESLPYPDVLPPYGRTLVDSELNLWMEEFRVTGEESYAWSVFDAGGTWLGRVTLPGGLRVFEIGADYVLGRSVDELDVERVLVYALVKGGGCGVAT